MGFNDTLKRVTILHVCVVARVAALLVVRDDQQSSYPVISLSDLVDDVLSRPDVVRRCTLHQSLVDVAKS